MKRVFILFLALATSLFLTACEEAPVATPTPTPGQGPTGGQSTYNVSFEYTDDLNINTVEGMNIGDIGLYFYDIVEEVNTKSGLSFENNFDPESISTYSSLYVGDEKYSLHLYAYYDGVVSFSYEHAFDFGEEYDCEQVALEGEKYTGIKVSPEVLQGAVSEGIEAGMDSYVVYLYDGSNYIVVYISMKDDVIDHVSFDFTRVFK